MRRVLFDSDVLLDVLAQRQPFVVSSAQALNTVTRPQMQGYVAGHAVRDFVGIEQFGVSAITPAKFLESIGALS